MADGPHLHRDDLQLFAGLLADELFAGATGASQLVLGQVVDDLDTRQVGRQRLALATALDRCNDFFGFGWCGGQCFDRNRSTNHTFKLSEGPQMLCSRFSWSPAHDASRPQGQSRLPLPQAGRFP